MDPGLLGGGFMDPDPDGGDGGGGQFTTDVGGGRHG